MAAAKHDTPGEERDRVPLTNLDGELFDGADATKRDLVDYLDAVHGQILTQLRDRPLSVMRVRPGQPPFMQKNVPKYTPSWIRTRSMWAEASHREVSYALCDDRRTLFWFANQRAVEYHVQLWRSATTGQPDHLVLDLDPPEEAGPVHTDQGVVGFRHAVGAARLVRSALLDLGLDGALKTSGAKGVHVFVPIDPATDADDAAAATRAIAVRAARIDPELATTEYVKADRDGKVFVDPTRAHNATVIAAYSPRLRPGVPVSFPVAWDDADDIVPRDFTVRTAAAILRDSDPWLDTLPDPQRLPADLVAEGQEIPIARVAAMHEGKRRKRAAQQAQGQDEVNS